MDENRIEPPKMKIPLAVQSYDRKTNKIYFWAEKHLIPELLRFGIVQNYFKGDDSEPYYILFVDARYGFEAVLDYLENFNQGGYQDIVDNWEKMYNESPD